jgi:hypothetical protein
MDATITIVELAGAGKETLRDELVREYGTVSIEIVEICNEDAVHDRLTGSHIMLVCFDAGGENTLRATSDWLGGIARIPFRVLIVATKSDTIDNDRRGLLRKEMASRDTRDDITYHFLSACDRDSASEQVRAMKPTRHVLIKQGCCSTG